MENEQAKIILESCFNMARALQLIGAGLFTGYVYFDFNSCRDSNPNFDFGDLDAAQYAFNAARLYHPNENQMYYFDFDEFYALCISSKVPNPITKSISQFNSESDGH